MSNRNRTIGPVTGATTAGGGLGAALAQILVHFFPDLEPVESAFTIVVTVLLALVFGWAVPPKDDDAPDYEIHDELEDGGEVYG